MKYNICEIIKAEKLYPNENIAKGLNLVNKIKELVNDETYLEKINNLASFVIN
jgi:hypothetical protein